jgi:uncharacterized protein YjdB
MNGLVRRCKALLTALGCLAFIAGCGGGGGGGHYAIAQPSPAEVTTVEAQPPPAELTAVVVTPGNATVPSGAPQQYVATASFADGTSRDVTALSVWASATTATASVGSLTGLAISASPGTTVISALFGEKAGSATLTVTAATLQSVAISPGNRSIAGGVTQQFSAAGTYGDGTTHDITAISSFTSSAPAVATITASGGLATGVTAGSSVITVSAGGRSASTNLTVTAATLVSIALSPASPVLQIGTTRQLIVTGIYTDNTAADVSAMSTYVSATPAVATVSASTGLVSAVSAGSSSITATFEGRTASAGVTVAPATLASIALSPASPVLQIGTTQQLIVTASYSDGSVADVSGGSAYASAAPAVATIGASTGLVTGVSAGTSSITATFGGRTASTGVTVAAATLVSIALSPASSVLQIATTQQLVVIATYSDSTVVDVSAASSYASAAPTVATVGVSTGLVTGVSAGTSTITATFGGRTASAGVTVAAATLVSIGVTPASPSIASGSSQQLHAMGTYSDGSTAGLTTDVSWSSGSTAVATILAGGMATGHSVGASTISATLGAVSGSTSLAVTAALPATINLGAASNFGVLAGTLLTSNAGGTTFITGDVGAPAQTADPVQAAGYLNYKSGPGLTDALSDLQAAVTDANGRTCDTTFGAAIDLGGMTLTPGVYCYDGAISINGALTLNGAGLYIIRTPGALNTAASSQVVLASGASADKLFFVPAGASTIGANSVLRGTLLSSAGAITVGDNTTVQRGRVLTGAAVTLQNNQIAVP